MTPEQLAYVKTELARGISPDLVRETLLQNGYSEQLVAELFMAVDNEFTPAPAPEIPQQQEPQPQTFTPEISLQTQTQTPIPVSPEKKSKILRMILIIIGTLVVVGIVVVGLVATSLNSAIDSGNDAIIQQNMGNARSNAELYAVSNNDSYAGLCESTRLRDITDSLPVVVDCIDSDKQYRISAPLTSGLYFCVSADARTDEFVLLSEQLPVAPTGFTCE